MPKITQTTLASLHQTGKIQYAQDESLTGFGIKVTAKGKASYFVESRVKGGRAIRKAIGLVDHVPLDDARSDARGMLHRLKQGVDASTNRPCITAARA